MTHAWSAEATVSDDELYRRLIDAVTDYGLYMLDLSGTVISWNPGAQRMKGYDAAEIIGRHFSRFYTVEDQETGEPQAALDTAARDGRFEETGWRVRKGGSRFWANVVIDPVHGSNGAIVGFAKVTRDLTESNEAQLGLEQAREEVLFQLQKMQSVGQLTAGLAHDFNNMLTVITGCLEMVQARLTQGRRDEVDRYVAAARTAAERAAWLTCRLLVFSRQQVLLPKMIDVNRLMAGMVEIIRRTGGPAVTVEAVGAGGLWNTLVDPNQLENALLNLCINAGDAMPDGGRLTIETGNRWLDEHAAKSRDLPAGQYVSLCVSDTGTGMTPEVIQRAFEPFFSTKPLGQGTGLGLSMIHGFAQQSGGQVRIHSELGQGSMVCIYLPRHHGVLDPEDASLEPAPSLQHMRGATVLVVDEEEAIRMLVSDVLADMGYQAIEAAEASAAMGVLQSDARIDLLLTDIRLPGMTGRQLAEAARRFRPELKVLFITGYAENAVFGNGVLEAGMDVLTKPFALEQLAVRINGIVARGTLEGARDA